MSSGGFDHWKLALEYDKKLDFEKSRKELEEAAIAFFEEGSGPKAGVSRSLFEYSTLMDALSCVQLGRKLRNELSFDQSLENFVKASEILRATVHYAYLASYVSGCATLETAMEMENREDMFQGLKNAIALFEQSKLALSFRDERHPSVRQIDTQIKFAISRALLAESAILSEEGSTEESKKKIDQSKSVEADFVKLSEANPSRYRVEYLTKYDCERALKGSLLVTFPEATSLWIGNVGVNPAKIETLGKEKPDKSVRSSESIVVPLESTFHGKLRIGYVDCNTGSRFDEGCLTAI